MARISLVFHLVRYHSGETKRKDIDQSSLRNAAKLIDYFKAHIARFYSLISHTEVISKAISIPLWADRHDKTEVTVREVITARIAENRAEALDLFDDLIEAGIGNWADPEKKRVFCITPTQHSATQQNG